MHHAILGLSGRDQTAIEAGRLRPSSASLPPHAMTELEALLRAVIESYGMTEAAQRPRANAA